MQLPELGNHLQATTKYIYTPVMVQLNPGMSVISFLLPKTEAEDDKNDIT